MKKKSGFAERVGRKLDMVWAVVGVCILAAGLQEFSFAQTAGANPGVMDDSRIFCAGQRILGLVEGNFGALVMVGAGLGTIISSALGAFRAASSLLVVACAAFILRSLVNIFFTANEGRLGDGTAVTASDCNGSATDPGESAFPE